MTRDVLADATEAVRLAGDAVRRAETYYDWAQGGPKHTELQNARVDLSNIHCKLIALANLPDENLSEEHNL